MKDGWWIRFFTFTFLFPLLKFLLAQLALWLNLRQNKTPGSTLLTFYSTTKCAKSQRRWRDIAKWLYSMYNGSIKSSARSVNNWLTTNTGWLKQFVKPVKWGDRVYTSAHVGRHSVGSFSVMENRFLSTYLLN